MFSYQILAFSQQKSILKSIEEELLPFFNEATTTMHVAELERLKKYVFQYAIHPDVRDKPRNKFYELIERISERISAGATNQCDNYESQVQNPDIEKRESHFTLMDEILEPENLRKLIGDKKPSSSSESEAEEIDPNLINQTEPRVFKLFATSAMYQHELQENEFENSKMTHEENDDEDIIIDNEENLEMTFEELQQKLPPYAMLSKKKKRVFFKSLSKDFDQKIQIRKSSKKIKKVNFNIQSNQIISFYKNQTLNA